MDHQTRQQVAGALLAAYDSKEPLEPLTATHEGMTLEDAYAIQLLQIDERLAARPHRQGPQGRPHQSPRCSGCSASPSPTTATCSTTSSTSSTCRSRSTGSSSRASSPRSPSC